MATKSAGFFWLDILAFLFWVWLIFHWWEVQAFLDRLLTK